MESRSKAEIVHDIEEARDEASVEFYNSKRALTRDNPAIRIWKRTRTTVAEATDRIAAKAQEEKIKWRVRAEQADMVIHDNVYRSVIVAACLGVFVGFMVKRSLRKRSRCDA